MGAGWERVMTIAILTGMGALAFMWMSLRIRFYKKFEPENSMIWQAVAHFFQGLTWIDLAWFYGADPLFSVPVLRHAGPVFFSLYLGTWLIAYYFKEEQLRRILERRISVHEYWQAKMKEVEEKDATSS
jgi:hypothetical protein